MDLSTVLRELYESELNCSIRSAWHSGWTVKLGDDLNGFVAKGTFGKVEEVAEFLHATALAHFPTSHYAKRHSK